MALIPIAGSKIEIGGVVADQAADFILTDFAAEVWVEIDGWETQGSAGDTSTLITTQLINRGRDVKQKGTRNAGSMQNNFAVVTGDAGQTALLAAEGTNDNYAIRITFPNADERYFIAIIMGAAEQGGGANTIHMIQSVFEINSNIVRN